MVVVGRVIQMEGGGGHRPPWLVLIEHVREVTSQKAWILGGLKSICAFQEKDGRIWGMTINNPAYLLMIAGPHWPCKLPR